MRTANPSTPVRFRASPPSNPLIFNASVHRLQPTKAMQPMKMMDIAWTIARCSVGLALYLTQSKDLTDDCLEVTGLPRFCAFSDCFF